MGRPLGINAIMAAAVETTYGQTPAGTFYKLPFVSHALGEEQPLIEDDQLGFGREGLDPTYDVITNDGDIVVPVDLRGIGFWLRQTFGAPVTTGPTTGKYVHTFSSGASALPSTSIEIGSPDMPLYTMHYGAMVNQLKISLARSGMLNATLSMIAQGQIDPVAASAAGTLTARTGSRFAQATGSITVDGVAAGDIVSADVNYTNNLDKVEVIRADGRIGGIDPGVAKASGAISTRFSSRALLDKATSKAPVALTFGWTLTGGYSLVFTLSRVFLPKPKLPITGPKGIMADFNWQASGANGPQLTAVLTNDVTSYA
ncbi:MULTISPECIES: phage tail tube protein [unclassified Sphingomonas]|uniref:phage tail tube protein n=1 Tax=unclassified Sphingomonas TaxID=196159 RepID=UPI00226A5DBD|nr:MULTISPECIES: phage tail tube protein [unclassified Sphingomonas]